VQSLGPTPTNFLAKKTMAFLRISRRRAPWELRELGFQRIEFSVSEGCTWITLHKGSAIDSTTRFNPSSGNIAAVTIPDGPHVFGSSELAVFDTARSRIGATRIPAPTSLDDPDSPLARLTEIAPEIFKLAGRAAHAPQLGSLMAAAFPRITQQARRWRGTATIHSIRIADLQRYLPSREICYIRIGREDREFDPPPWISGASQAQRWQHVIEMLHAVSMDVQAAWTEFVATREMAALTEADLKLTYRLVELSWASLSHRSLDAFIRNLMWPLPLRLLGLDDGAAQYVLHVAEGREP
jgi:hypothetical protein